MEGIPIHLQVLLGLSFPNPMLNHLHGNDKVIRQFELKKVILINELLARFLRHH